MPTNLAIDDDLLVQAKTIGKHKTKKAAVTEALQEYIQRRKQIEVTQIFGSIETSSPGPFSYQEKGKRRRDRGTPPVPRQKDEVPLDSLLLPSPPLSRQKNASER